MKRLKIVYVLVICVILAAPLLLMPFAKDASAEKRTLSAFPELINENGFNLEFTAEADTWFSEHFPFRSQIISANNYLKASVFSTSDEEQVIVGKEGWLYFADTLPDYFGENILSDMRLAQLQTVLSLMEEHVRAGGAAFVFTVAPNKNTIYPEYMPDRYRKTNEKTNLERITALLGEKAYFADMTAALSDKTVQLYHARDSHWNAYGALCGYRAIMHATSRRSDLFDTAAYTWENTWRGDLDDMIFPAFDFKDAQAEYAVDWSYTFTSNYHSEEDLLITTENESGEGALLMFRDSFANALLPFLAQTYQTTTLSRATPYDLRKAGEYDTVVVEIVERNLSNLLRTAPIMQAPAREVVQASVVEDAVVSTREKDALLHIYGTMPQGAKKVYLQLSNGEDKHIVEAFPIYEATLLGEEEDIHENGFSAYLPMEYKDYTVTVMTGKDE